MARNKGRGGASANAELGHNGAEAEADAEEASDTRRRGAVALASSPLEMLLRDAAQSLQLSDRDKAHLVQRQLVQFSEVLKIQLRARVYQARSEARQLWRALEASGGLWLAPNGAQAVLGESTAMPQPAASPGAAQLGAVASGLLGGGMASAVGLMAPAALVASRVAGNLKHAVGLGVLYKAAGLWAQRQQAVQLAERVNLLLAFQENGEDETESERVIRGLAEELSLRHIKHVSRLSKTGQRTFASVMADRVCTHLSRHAASFEEESPLWLKREAQQRLWAVQGVWARATRPPDRVRARPALPLLERCVRALVCESSPADSWPLELESLQPPGTAPWTGGELLARAAVRLPDGTLFGHETTDASRFAFVYGTEAEVAWRRLRPLARL